MTETRVPICNSTESVSRAIWDEAWMAYEKRHGGGKSQHDRLLRQGFYAGELDEFRPGWRPVDLEILSLSAQVAALTKERDQAIAHDRQPYPTAWAYEQACKQVAELRALLDTPEIEDFVKAVKLEAAHQIERWGTVDDRGKTPADWFWLVGYLAGKALHAANAESLPRYRHKKRGGTYEVISIGENENSRGEQLIVYRGEDDGKIWVRPVSQFFDGRFEELPRKPSEKALHHCISSAAALCNWHAAIKSGTPGHMRPGSDVEKIVAQAFPGEVADGGS